MPSATQNYQRLYDVAAEQGGFFTTKQAMQAGYGTNSHPYHVRRGSWIREYRGIYRLANYPVGERPDLMRWYLWSRDRNEQPQGVYSHETALALHELTDVNPARLSMTVPKGFRRNSAIPDILELRFDRVPSEEKEQLFGVSVTSAIRTITDVITEGLLSEDLLRQAIREAVRSGRISKRRLKSAGDRGGAVRTFLEGVKL